MDATMEKKAIRCRLNPAPERLVVRPDTAEERTEAGIYLPETAKQDITLGTVLAAGKPGEVGRALELAPGARVLYSRYAGTDVKIDDEDVKVMHEADILGTMPGGDPP